MTLVKDLITLPQPHPFILNHSLIKKKIKENQKRNEITTSGGIGKEMSDAQDRAGVSTRAYTKFEYNCRFGEAEIKSWC